MEDKIKVYVPESVNNILLKDMERFEFYKKDGSFNKNDFYNTLIINYYKQYHGKQSELFNFINRIINEETYSSDVTSDDIATRILEFINLKTNNLDEEPSEVTLSIKPTKKSSEIIDFIQWYAIGNSSLSGYFRNMFTSYSLLPQDKRELIIFKDNFEIIERAIEEKKKLYFVITKSGHVHTVSPYAITNSKEELFNYMLADCDGNAFTYRVGRLKKIIILNEPADISKENIQIFEKMIDQGPQYDYHKGDINTKIMVYLTDLGKENFKNLYLHRPKCTKIDGNYYYFECSYVQAYQYFRRFGKEAIIMLPLDLVMLMHNFYKNSYEAYDMWLHQGLIEGKDKGIK